MGHSGSVGAYGKYCRQLQDKEALPAGLPVAQRISPQNRVELRSLEEAIRQGYESCKVCDP